MAKTSSSPLGEGHERRLEGCEPGEAVETVRRLVEALLPLGPSLMFLLRATELDDAAAQALGDVDPALPAWWVVETLLAGVHVGWEQIAGGRLAPVDTPDLVVRTWLRGVGPQG